MKTDNDTAPTVARVTGKGAPPPAAGYTLGALSRKEDATSSVKSERKDSAEKGKKKPAKSAAKAKKASKAKRVVLKLRVPADLRKAFRKAAAAQDAKRGELFARIFADWHGRNPG